MLNFLGQASLHKDGVLDSNEVKNESANFNVENHFSPSFEIIIQFY